MYIDIDYLVLVSIFEFNLVSINFWVIIFIILYGLKEKKLNIDIFIFIIYRGCFY